LRSYSHSVFIKNRILTLRRQLFANACTKTRVFAKLNIRASHQAVSPQARNLRNLSAFCKTPFPRFAKQNTPPAFPLLRPQTRVFAKNTVSSDAQFDCVFAKNSKTP
jgi:hypothetical protein